MTDQPSADVLRLAGRLLAHLEDDARRETWDTATHAVVVVTDLATGDLSIHGPFPKDTLDAPAWAAEFAEEVNRGASPDDTPPWNQGWTCVVHPLLPPGDLT